MATPLFPNTHLYASGIKSADFWIRIAEKTRDSPYRLSEKWMTLPYAFIKNRQPPPLYSATPTPTPSAEIYEQSLPVYGSYKYRIH